MTEIFAYVTPGGRLKQARGSVTLANNTAKSEVLEVPAGKRWLVYGIMMHNGDDVARDLKAYITDGDGNFLMGLGYANGVSAGSRSNITEFIQTSAGYYAPPVARPFPIKSGNKLVLRWDAGGTSTGGTAYYCVTYLEVEE